jgi:peptidoglycan/xylan/chitin deacetylase (PgdA/CDA1 family)
MTITASIGYRPAFSSSHILWTGGNPRPNEVPWTGTERLPILMYHRVAPVPEGVAERFCVTPQNFERQIRFLRDCGFRSLTPDEWLAAIHRRRHVPGKAVSITFDDAYSDFQEFAWPILSKYGFTATLFVVTGNVGGRSGWAEKPAPLLDWPAIRRLDSEGVEIGSYTHSHTSLLRLSVAHRTSELARSRLVLEDALGRRISVVAYPYGDVDAVTEHLAGGCGYECGFGIRAESSRLTDPPLELPRLEVSGCDSFEYFVSKLWVGRI